MLCFKTEYGFLIQLYISTSFPPLRSNHFPLKFFEYKWCPGELPRVYPVALCTPILTSQVLKFRTLAETLRPLSNWPCLPPSLVSATIPAPLQESQTEFPYSLVFAVLSDLSLFSLCPEDPSLCSMSDCTFPCSHSPTGHGGGVITCTPFVVAVNPLDPDLLWAYLSFPTKLRDVIHHLHHHLPAPSMLGTNQALDKPL